MGFSFLNPPAIKGYPHLYKPPFGITCSDKPGGWKIRWFIVQEWPHFCCGNRPNVLRFSVTPRKFRKGEDENENWMGTWKSWKMFSRNMGFLLLVWEEFVAMGVLKGTRQPWDSTVRHQVPPWKTAFRCWELAWSPMALPAARSPLFRGLGIISISCQVVGSFLGDSSELFSTLLAAFSEFSQLFPALLNSSYLFSDHFLDIFSGCFQTPPFGLLFRYYCAVLWDCLHRCSAFKAPAVNPVSS